MQGAHICMSGMLECSGVDPCERCSSAILTYVLVPAMKAANIDQRNDPRVASFLRTYAEASKALVAGLMQQVAAMQLPLPMVPPPSMPPVADLPLTAAELEQMATPVTVPGPTAVMGPPMAGGPEPEFASLNQADGNVYAESSPVPVGPPPGLMSDDEFKTRFPTIPPETVMELPPTITVNVEPPEPVSLMKLASQAITPKLKDDEKVIYQDSDSVITTQKLPAEKLVSDGEVGSAPTEPAPLPPPQPKAVTVDVSAVAVSANLPAETTSTSVQDTKAEASTHG